MSQTRPPGSRAWSLNHCEATLASSSSGRVTVCRSKEQGRKDGKEGRPLSMTFGHEKRTAVSIILSENISHIGSPNLQKLYVNRAFLNHYWPWEGLERMLLFQEQIVSTMSSGYCNSCFDIDFFFFLLHSIIIINLILEREKNVWLWQ